MLYGGDLENVDCGKDAGAHEAQAHRQDPRDGDLQAADIERPTFYYHFRDKYDLIAWEFPEIYEVFSARRSWMRKPSGRNRIDVPFLTGIPLVADLRHAL